MAGRTSTPRKIAQRAQRRWDRLKLEVKRRLRLFDPPTILAYRGHGAGRTLNVTGRIVEEKGVEPPDDDGSVLRNMINAVRRVESDELPGARVVARYGEKDMAQGVTDQEGFFKLVVETSQDLDPGWHDVEIELMESMAGGGGLKATAEIVVPPPDAEFAVISDVDDTVLESHAADPVIEARLVLSRSARERAPMPGAVPLYRMLEGGADREGWNPFFYVSNSGWGLYDLFERFLDHSGLPRGPLYLQDLAFLEAKSPVVGSETHKVDTIESLLGDYPDLSFVLIGDSGQHDPETYRQIVRTAPDRIRAVLIRDVAPPERDREVRTIIQEIADAGVAAAAAESSISLARAAADFGLIPDDAIAEVREAMVEERR